MARQKGIIKLKGSIGDITFYKSKDGYLAREKGGIDKDRFLNDPKFQRTRENASEFGRAGKASKVLCTAIRPVLNKIQDSRMISRLVKLMMTVIKADAVSDRGLRNVLDGELMLLQGFDFNDRARLNGTLYAPFTSTIDRATGILDVSVDISYPDSQIIAAGGTTHFRIISAGVEVDFESGEFNLSQSNTAEMLYSVASSSVINLSNDIGVLASTKPLFLLLGIEFLQEVNGSFYSLNNGAFNALNLVKIDTGV